MNLSRNKSHNEYGKLIELYLSLFRTELLAP
jgi:uncharacterized protein Veg